jgi:hypothetical protein
MLKIEKYILVKNRDHDTDKKMSGLRNVKNINIHILLFVQELNMQALILITLHSQRDTTNYYYKIRISF